MEKTTAKKDKVQEMAIVVSVPVWNIEEMTGYKPKTTFWSDFSIADRFGTDAVKDTYNRAFAEWKGNTEYVTELVMVLNWKIWQYYKTRKDLAEVYNDLWEQSDQWCQDNLTGKDADYYFRTTD